MMRRSSNLRESQQLHTGFGIDNLSLVDNTSTVFWFRRDLRLKDNAALYHALRENSRVIPLFIFDEIILNELEDKRDARVAFILESLRELQRELLELGTSLLVVYGDPVEIFRRMSPKSVYANHDYEQYAIARDSSVSALLQEKGAEMITFKDQVIFEKDEIVKSDGKPYTVFTPYSKQWKQKLNDSYLKPYPCQRYFGSFFKTRPLPLPELPDIGFQPPTVPIPERRIPLSIIGKYDQTRDIPAVRGTSRLGIHLRFGTISIRHLVALALKKNQTWLNELIWREFYQMILWHFPHVEKGSFKPAYDRIPWTNDEDDFKKWCKGKTGYPLVDAGMRELNATGFMHNRVRMVTASFLTKHLLIDWRWGEAFFAAKLLDYELASNNGGWQWAAGSGCDAAPYFRIFNPELQQQKFDPHYEYIRKWIPGFEPGNYLPKVVEHNFARQRAINIFKKTVG